jgi:hypothetical protein
MVCPRHGVAARHTMMDGTRGFRRAVRVAARTAASVMWKRSSVDELLKAAAF